MTAVEAMERQIPQKAITKIKVEPIIDERGAYIDAEIYLNLTCPRCGNQVGYESDFDNYCSECGQAIGGIEE